MKKEVVLTDHVIEAEMALCLEYVNEIKNLEKSDPKKYKKTVAALRTIVQGGRPTDDLNPVFESIAESILEELGIDTAIKVTRADCERILTEEEEGGDREIFMGNDEVFVSLEDARQNRPDREAVLRSGLIEE